LVELHVSVVQLPIAAGARPFYDLLCSIATEEFGHVELVASTINTMLTDPGEADNGRAPDAALASLAGVGNPHHFIAGARAALPQNSQGGPGTATTSSRPAT
jgi:Mn-containing catalase